MCTDTQYPSVVKEEPAFLCTVSVYSLVYPVYVRVRLNICKIRDQPPLDLLARPPIRCDPLNMRHLDFNIIFKPP